MPKKVTLQDIADRLGISLKAVSLGVNGGGRLSDETRARIRRAALEMGYVPNSAARTLAGGRSLLFGVLALQLNGSFFGNIVAGIEEVAHKRGVALLLEGPHREERHLCEAVARLAERRIDGIFVYPSPSVEVAAPDLLTLGIPVVQLMNHLSVLGDAVVRIDNRAAGARVARHFLALGHRKIGLLTHDRGGPEMAERSRGFREALEVIPEELECEWETGAGCAAAHALLRRNPEISAIFAASDYAALGVVKAALESGRRIPQELAVAGFDDLDIASNQLLYPLTTVAQPKEEIGRRAAGMMFDLLDDREVSPLVLEAPLIVRETTETKAMK